MDGSVDLRVWASIAGIAVVMLGAGFKFYGNHREHDVKLDRLEGTAQRVSDHHADIQVLDTKVTTLDGKVDNLDEKVTKVGDTQTVILTEIRRGFNRDR